MDTLYNRTEHEIARTFIKGIESKKYIATPVELNSKKAKALYDSFIDLTIKSHPTEFFQDSFVELSRREISDLFTDILFMIFGDENNLVEEIRDFFNSLQISCDRAILSGVNLTVMNPITYEKKVIVEIPSINNTSSIVSLVHEFIHAHSGKIGLDMHKKYYFNEILSIFAEKVATYYIEKIIDTETNMTKKIESTRLEGISWHYTERIKQLEQVRSLYNNLKREYSTNPIILEFEDNFPWLTDKKYREGYFLYKDNLAYSYGFGYIYAEALFQRFLENEKATSSNVAKVLNTEISMNDLFNYYNIRINQPTITTAKQKVKAITK